METCRQKYGRNSLPTLDPSCARHPSLSLSSLKMTSASWQSEIEGNDRNMTRVRFMGESLCDPSPQPPTHDHNDPYPLFSSLSARALKATADCLELDISLHPHRAGHHRAVRGARGEADGRARPIACPFRKTVSDEILQLFSQPSSSRLQQAKGGRSAKKLEQREHHRPQPTPQPLPSRHHRERRVEQEGCPPDNDVRKPVFFPPAGLRKSLLI